MNVIFLYVLFTSSILDLGNTHKVQMPSMRTCLKVMEKSVKRDDLVMYCGTQHATWCEAKPAWEDVQYEEVTY